MQGKKWLIVITDDQYKWLVEATDETGLSGSDIAREALALAMNDKEFKSGLATAQMRMELDELEKKREVIAEKEAELKRRLKGSRIGVTA